MAFKNGYHGETFGAMSVSDRNLFAKPFLHALFEVDYIDPPTCGKEEDSIKQAQAILSKNETACFIFEPLVQGASGMKKHEVKGLDALIKLCHTHDVLTIADEVMTGFGRLGSNFAIDKLTTKPDMICLAKGLTGGFLPLAATLCTEKIYEQFLSSDYSKTFLHGHSYSANPLGCASAIASIELLDQVNCQIQRRDIEKQHRAFLNKWDSHPKIKNAFVEGTLLQIEYKSEKASSYFNPLRKQISEYFLSQNILIRPLGNSIHVLPPYSIKKEELALIYQAIENTLEKILW